MNTKGKDARYGYNKREKQSGKGTFVNQDETVKDK
jgi:hypothetical protein